MIFCFLFVPVSLFASGRQKKPDKIVIENAEMKLVPGSDGALRPGKPFGEKIPEIKDIISGLLFLIYIN